LEFGGFWEQNCPVVIVAGIVLVCVITARVIFFPKADAASLRSSLIIAASSSATLLGFIFVSLAMLTGRATSTSERLLDAWRSHELELSKLAELVFQKCTEAASSKAIELDWEEKPLGHPDSLSLRRWNRWALMEVVSLRASMLARRGSFKASGPVLSVLESFGLERFRGHVGSVALKSSQSAAEMWDTTRRAIGILQNSEFMTIDEVPHAVMHVREILFKGEIYEGLETIARRRRASGRLFWLCTSASILTITSAFLVGSGITDDTIDNVQIRAAFELAIGLWWIAVSLVLAYVRQVLRE